MGFKAVNCPSCGASVELDSSREFGFCSYCGTKIVQDKIIHEHRGSVIVEGTANVASLTERARIMLSDGDFRSADTYFDRVLDIDPHNAYAYWGKMCCSIGVRNDEQLENYPYSVKSIPSFHKAIEFSKGDEHERYVALGNATEENQYRIAKERCDNTVKKAKKALKIKGIIHGFFSFPFIVACLTTGTLSSVYFSLIVSAGIFFVFSASDFKILALRRKSSIFTIPPVQKTSVKVLLAFLSYLLLILFFVCTLINFADDENQQSTSEPSSTTISEDYSDI